MGADQQDEGVMSSLEQEQFIGEEQSDDKPTMRAPARPRKDRTLVLSGLLIVSCCTAALAQWMPLHASASETKRPVRKANVVAAAEVDTDMVLDVEVAEAASEPEQERDDVGEQPEQERTAKVRDSDALVRDANRLLPREPALARSLFALAAATDPRNPHAHAGLAHALHKLGKSAEARDAIEQALRIRPKRASYRAFLKALDAAK